MDLSRSAQLNFFKNSFFFFFPFQQPIDATMFLFLYNKVAERTEMLLFWEDSWDLFYQSSARSIWTNMCRCASL